MEVSVGCNVGGKIGVLLVVFLVVENDYHSYFLDCFLWWVGFDLRGRSGGIRGILLPEASITAAWICVFESASRFKGGVGLLHYHVYY